MRKIEYVIVTVCFVIVMIFGITGFVYQITNPKTRYEMIKEDLKNTQERMNLFLQKHPEFVEDN